LNILLEKFDGALRLQPLYRLEFIKAFNKSF
jgi:hypothetical protein